MKLNQIKFLVVEPDLQLGNPLDRARSAVLDDRNAGLLGKWLIDALFDRIAEFPPQVISVR